MTKTPIGVAFPWSELDRAAFREATGGRVRIPRVKDGSTLEPCKRCRVPVTVGPRLQASGLQVICALCAHHLGLDGFR